MDAGARLSAVLVLVTLASSTVVGEAHALTPANDDRADARRIEELPYTDEEDTLLATREADEPSSSCGSSEATVWYEYTPPASQRLVVDTNGSDRFTTVAVYDDAGEVDCGWGSPWSEQPAVIFDASAGTRYFFQVDSDRYISPSPLPDTQDRLVFSVAVLEPPDNDDRAHTEGIDELPYRDERSTLGATLEQDEPQPCGEIGATVW